jgi:hypothetical protein
MAERYFLKRGKTVKGPFSIKKLQELLSAKKLKANDRIACDSTGPWCNVAKVHSSLREGNVAEKLQWRCLDCGHVNMPENVECLDCGIGRHVVQLARPNSRRDRQYAAQTNSETDDLLPAWLVYRNEEAVTNLLGNVMAIVNLGNIILATALLCMLLKHGITDFASNPFAPYMAFLGATLNPLGKMLTVFLFQGALFAGLHYCDEILCNLFCRALEKMPRWMSAGTHLVAAGYEHTSGRIAKANEYLIQGFIVGAGVAKIVLLVCGGGAALLAVAMPLYWLCTAPAQEVASRITDIFFWGVIIVVGVGLIAFLMSLCEAIAGNVKNIYVPVDIDGDGDTDFIAKF